MNPSEFDNTEFDPSSFAGIARLFPIPNLVMFPHVMQPLHIFEERYREMMEDAVAGDGLIAMPILKQGWEADYAGRPPIEPWACLGRVVLHHKLEDGCFNLLLKGVMRARIVSEVEPVRSFRQARLVLVEDIVPTENDPRAASLVTDLTASFSRQLAHDHRWEPLRQFFDSAFPLGQLTDTLAFALPLPASVKRRLLSEACAVQRGRELLEQLELIGAAVPSRCSAAQAFPPRFSDN